MKIPSLPQQGPVQKNRRLTMAIYQDQCSEFRSQVSVLISFVFAPIAHHADNNERLHLHLVVFWWIVFDKTMPPLSPGKSQGHSNHTRRGCNEYAKYSEGPTQKWQHGNSKHFQVIGHEMLPIWVVVCFIFAPIDGWWLLPPCPKQLTTQTYHEQPHEAKEILSHW